MCGIAGIINHNQISPEAIEQVKKMNQIQKHRGPDDEGIFHDDYCVIGHRRLSIIDLSSNGHQPFTSNDNRYHLIYNGEIYNYLELREDLIKKGLQFKTQTDTEVLLKAYLHFGKDCLSHLNGMFAFAIYDTYTHKLFLARDRVGIKPLYYALIDSTFYFASEIKTLLTIPQLKKTINQKSLFDYLVFNRTDVYDETFLTEIKRIPKGNYATFENCRLTLAEWWNPLNYLEKSNTDNLSEIKESIDFLLSDAVKLRMRSDVPVGSCLSGGLDSSILIGILFDHHWADRSFQTFTASFPNHLLDETRYIDGLNQRFPFQNLRTFPTGQTAYEDLKKFTYTNDEPTTGPAFYSQYKVMELAQGKVTVLLDGQGGDENFAGYHYFHGFYLHGLLHQMRILKFIKEMTKTLTRKQNILSYQTLLFQQFSGDLKKKALFKKIAPYIRKDFFTNHIDQSKVYNDFFDADNLNISLARHFQYKLEHLLRMEDRNSMAFSLETRLPYLDYRLIEYILNIDPDLKIKDGNAKYLQKISVGKYTTSEIIDRRDKIGFGTPSEDWFQEPFWRKKTHEASAYCEEHFSNIFQENFLKKLPYNNINHWKINQLALWHQMIQS